MELSRLLKKLNVTENESKKFLAHVEEVFSSCREEDTQVLREELQKEISERARPRATPLPTAKAAGTKLHKEKEEKEEMVEDEDLFEGSAEKGDPLERRTAETELTFAGRAVALSQRSAPPDPRLPKASVPRPFKINHKEIVSEFSSSRG